MQTLDPSKIVISPPPYPGFGPDKADGPPGYYENPAFLMPPIYEEIPCDSSPGTSGISTSVSRIVSDSPQVHSSPTSTIQETGASPSSSTTNNSTRTATENSTTLSQTNVNSPRISRLATSGEQRDNLTPVSIDGQQIRQT